MSWQDDLQPASWRGVEFGVLDAGGEVGRNTAEHLYPFRTKDPVWVEDVGLGPKGHRIVGFLTGDDVVNQLDDMLEAAQKPGQGELVHPMLGSLTGSIVGRMRFDIRRDGMRYVELAFAFVENEATAPYPVAQTNTKDGVASAAATAKASVTSDFGTAVQGAVSDVKGTISDIKAGVSSFVASTGIPQIVKEVSGFGRQALGAVGSASSLFNGVRSVLGPLSGLGRYAPSSGLSGLSSVSSALGVVSRAQSQVRSAVGTMNRLARLL